MPSGAEIVYYNRDEQAREKVFARSDEKNCMSTFLNCCNFVGGKKSHNNPIDLVFKCKASTFDGLAQLVSFQRRFCIVQRAEEQGYFRSRKL